MPVTSISSTSTTVDPAESFAASGDIGAEVAALAVQSGQTQRRNADQARDALEASQENEEDQEVQAMRKKADDVRSESLAEGISSVVASGGEMVNHAYGSATTGIGKVVGSFYAANSANDDADAAQHKAAADRAGTAANDMHDAAKAGDDYANSAIEFYREFVATEAATQSAAVHKA